MINDLKDAPSKKRVLGPNKTSSKFSLPTITENPLDQTSINSDYPSDNLQLSPNRNNDAQNSNGIISPPPFYVLHVNYLKCQNLNSIQNVNPVLQSLLKTQNQSHNLCHILHYPIIQMSLPNLTLIS